MIHRLSNRMRFPTCRCCCQRMALRSKRRALFSVSRYLGQPYLRAHRSRSFDRQCTRSPSFHALHFRCPWRPLWQTWQTLAISQDPYPPDWPCYLLLVHSSQIKSLVPKAPRPSSHQSLESYHKTNLKCRTEFNKICFIFLSHTSDCLVEAQIGTGKPVSLPRAPFLPPYEIATKTRPRSRPARANPNAQSRNARDATTFRPTAQ